jgi:hypothetical protein
MYMLLYTWSFLANQKAAFAINIYGYWLPLFTVSITNNFRCISNNIRRRKYLVFAFKLIVFEKLRSEKVSTSSHRYTYALRFRDIEICFKLLTEKDTIIRNIKCYLQIILLALKALIDVSELRQVTLLWVYLFMLTIMGNYSRPSRSFHLHLRDVSNKVWLGYVRVTYCFRDSWCLRTIRLYLGNRKCSFENVK